MLFPGRRTTDGKLAESRSHPPGTFGGEAPMVFDGKMDRRLPLGDYANLTTYTVDLRLISVELPKESQPYSETSPAMPFLVGANIVCRTEPGGYVVVLRDGNKDMAAAQVSGLFGSTRITVVSTAGGTTVFGNGIEVARAESPIFLDGFVRLGAGHLRRFWAGEIAYFDLFDQAKVNQGTFDASSGRFSADGRIATMPT